MFNAEIIKDSINKDGNRLTTFVVTFPRIVLAEFNTHRMLSRNSASSRAIPTEKMLDAVEHTPFIPEEFGSNKRGMQAGEPISAEESQAARNLWLQSKTYACKVADSLSELNVHKQIVNRVLEPYMWTTAIVSATEWHNFFALRVSKLAQPEIYKVAKLMLGAYITNKPEERTYHMPFINDWDIVDALSSEKTQLRLHELKLASTMRCARVSYTTHLRDSEIEADAQMCRDRLLTQYPRHASPFEHVATSSSEKIRSGNFTGWRQFRKDLSDENITSSHVNLAELYKEHNA